MNKNNQNYRKPMGAMTYIGSLQLFCHTPLVQILTTVLETKVQICPERAQYS